MKLSEIFSIAGKPGLYRFIASSKNAIIVEGLADKKRFPAYTSNKIMSLADISMFTTAEDIPLKDILAKLSEKYEKLAIPHVPADKKELFDFFAEIVPDFDQERVYPSDVKKLIGWYNELASLSMLDVEEEKEEEVTTEETVEENASEAVSGDESASKKAKPAKTTGAAEKKPKATAKNTRTPKPAGASSKAAGKGSRTATVQKKGQ